MRQETLTPKQERFCREYVVHHNGTKAAISTGYAERSADVTASRLLRNARVRERIAQLEGEAAARLEIKLDRVVGELACVAFARFDQVAEIGPFGVTPRSWDEIPENVRAAVAEVVQRDTESGGSIRIKMLDKLAALDKLMRHLGGYEDAKRDTNPMLTALAGMSEEELGARAERLRSLRLAAAAQET